MSSRRTTDATARRGTIAVVFGGPSPEHDVSVLTGLQAVRALAEGPPEDRVQEEQYKHGGPVAIYWTKTGAFFEVLTTCEGADFIDGTPKGGTALRFVAEPGGGFVRVARQGAFGRSGKPLEIDVLVNCCHGGPGEDGSLQGALDQAGIAYTGPGMRSAALCMDKLAFGAVVAAAGLPTLPRVALQPGAGGEAGRGDPGFDGPYIVKPRYGGSSIGIEVVADLPTATARLAASVHLRDGAVIEPYRKDLFDVQIALRSRPRLEMSAIERPLRSALGPGGSGGGGGPAHGGTCAAGGSGGEAISGGSSSSAVRTGAGTGEILGYADKYVGGQGMVGAPRELPAKLPEKLVKGVHDAAAVIAGLIDLRGVARVDFLTDGASELVVNEVNTIPGSLAKYLWVDPPLPFGRLLGDLIEEARQRPSCRYAAAGADGSALRSAGSIAGKLA